MFAHPPRRIRLNRLQSFGECNGRRQRDQEVSVILRSAGHEQGNSFAFGDHAHKSPELLLQFRCDQISALAGTVYATNQILRIRMTHDAVPPGLLRLGGFYPVSQLPCWAKFFAVPSGLTWLRSDFYCLRTQHWRAGLNSSPSLRDSIRNPQVGSIGGNEFRWV